MYRNSEKLFNYVAGLTILSWGFIGIVSNINTSIPIVRICTALLNIFIGAVFIMRRPLIQDATLKNLLRCIPSFLATGVVFKLSYDYGQWTYISNTLFIIGTAITLISFFYLGRSFAVLPAIRSIVVKGPYRIVRHPAYFGELLMITGCFLAAPLFVGIPFVIVFIAVVIRILAEEDTLLQDRECQEYYKIMPWRLIPYIW